jgi:hypothetical protein
MTTQATNATIGNSRMSRIFTATSTDGQYNNQNDSVTSTAIGLSMPNQTISFVAATHAAGNAIWRIISSQTNLIKRQGFCSLAGYSNPAECQIAPYKVQPDDLFQVYTLAVDATANESNVLALVTSNRGREAFVANNVADATATNLTSILSGLGAGDLLFGATISRVEVQEEQGGSLGSLIFTDAAGGIQFTGYGSQRMPTAGGQSNLTNGVFNVSMPVQKGWKMQVKVTSA